MSNISKRYVTEIDSTVFDSTLGELLLQMPGQIDIPMEPTNTTEPTNDRSSASESDVTSENDETETLSSLDSVLGMPEDDVSSGDMDDEQLEEDGYEVASGSGTRELDTESQLIGSDDQSVDPYVSGPDFAGAQLASTTYQNIGGSNLEFGSFTHDVEPGAIEHAGAARDSDGLVPGMNFDANAIDTNAADANAVYAPSNFATLNTLAKYLNNENGSGADYWQDSGFSYSPFINLTNSGTNAKNGVVTYNVTGFNWGDSNGLTPERADMIRHALNIFEDVLGINFVETTSNLADISFSDIDSSGAYADSVDGSNGSLDYGWINIPDDWAGGTSDIGSYSFSTAMHEIGHLLGLGHQGDYNGDGHTYDDAYWKNDSWQQSMMSYWAPWQNTDISADFDDLIGPMAVDWLALENIYGSQGYGIANGATTDNTTWGFNSTWYDWDPSSSSTGPLFGYSNSAYASMEDLLGSYATCIVDGGGYDTLDLSGFSNNTVIDVSECYGSSKTGSISSVAGKTGNLTIAVGTIIEKVIGGAGNEKILGNNVNNVLDGGSGHDTINGYNGSDTLIGGIGSDKLYGGGQSDTIYAGSGADKVWGGDGKDLAYLGDGNDVFNDNDQNDSSGVDEVYGGSGDDSIFGGGGNDKFYGDDGEDLIEGGIGSDTIRGGKGHDKIWGGKGSDSVWGGKGGDVAYLGKGDDKFYDHEQNDQYGNDEVYAGSGNDSIFGGGGKDKFFGEDGEDLIKGGTGNDSLYGGDQSDLLFGENGNDKVWGGKGKDIVYLGKGNDVFYDHDQNDQSGNDEVYAGDGNDIINVGGGSNILKGGNGADTFKFNASKATGSNKILDFDGGIDILQFSGLNYSDLTFQADGGGVLVVWNKGEVKLVDYGINDISADDFLFV